MRLARGLSSVGRAPALQAGGQRFEPVRLHHSPTLVVEDGVITPEMKIRVSRFGVNIEGFALFFDIVNGFLIDAVMAGL